MGEGVFGAQLKIFEKEHKTVLNPGMAPDLCVQHKIYNEEESFESDEMGSGLELGLSDMARYPHPFLPIWESYAPAWWSSSLGGPSPTKRLRRTPSVEEAIGSYESSFYSGGSSHSSSCSGGSSKQFNCLPRLQFRDHIWTYSQRFLAAEAVEEAAQSTGGVGGNGSEEEENGADGMRLVQLLIACAEAVACRDRSQASVLLSELRANALVFGTSFQRVASCFVQGLADRLALLQPLGAVGVMAPATGGVSTEMKEEALCLVYEVCPHIQFGHFVANASILEAFEGENSVHVVDLGMTLGLPHGHQWRALLKSLATRAGNPPQRVRITGVGPSDDHLQAIGHELEAYAEGLGIHLEFSAVKSCLENLKPENIKVVEGEVLVVNSMLQLHCVVKESRGALNSVLQIIHELSPKILVLVEQDSGHNGPFFLGRFMEALHYYSAIFDSLDAMLPKYDTRRAKIEQFYFAEEIKNIVSCEGPARVERHERVDQWRRRMSRAGFQPAPIKMIAQAKQWLTKVKVCEGYTIAEEKGCLVLGWKSKPIVAASCWKC
ncbi:GRAS family protein RAD1-like [Aristolochia californica]|uniref:GRAS family protein RAD1-like n=1 Tax=Aristolochia californica TaxID=171875 RepID=UPI0035D6207F